MIVVNENRQIEAAHGDGITGSLTPNIRSPSAAARRQVNAGPRNIGNGRR